jgi:hypothetical protein
MKINKQLGVFQFRNPNNYIYNKNPKKMRRQNIFIAFLSISFAIVFAPLHAQAANHYIRQGATGNSSGSDWTNACSSFTGSCSISSLVRGDTYFVADGSYGSQTFNKAASGTLVITIKKATVADHGTETGWDSTYGDGQATFGNAINFFTSNWVFDGVSGTDYQSGHGFIVDNTAGGNTSNIVVFGVTGGSGVQNITVSHTDVIGPGYNQESVNDRAFYSNSTGSTTSNLTISHNFVKGVGVPILTRQNDTMLVEYNQIDDNHSQAASHAETWSDTATDNVIFRYNRVRNPEGTAVIFNGNGSAGITNANTASNWQVYGNTIYYQNYVPGSGHTNGVSAILWCPPFDIYGGDTYCHNWMIYNNTFSNFSYSNQSARILGHAGTGITIPIVKGNIWDSSSSGANHADVNASYNYYRNTTHIAESNEQTGTSSPFVNAAGADFRLSGPTLGVSGFTVSATDANGIVRGGDGVWDRGAFEYSTGATSNTLNPPTGLTATPN